MALQGYNIIYILKTPQAYYELACNLYNSANVELNNIAEGNTVSMTSLICEIKHALGNHIIIFPLQ